MSTTIWRAGVGPAEKNANEATHEVRSDDGGRIVDIRQLGASSDLKTAADQHTILFPQPTSDPNDPLDWSPFKKHLMLFVISTVAFMPDFVSSMGIVTLIPQAL